MVWFVGSHGDWGDACGVDLVKDLGDKAREVRGLVSPVVIRTVVGHWPWAWVVPPRTGEQCEEVASPWVNEASLLCAIVHE